MNAEIIDSSSDDDGVDTTDDDVVDDGSRQKRHVTWSCMERAAHPLKYSNLTFKRVVWPPPTNPQPALALAYIDPRSVSSSSGNTLVTQKMQLFCKTGFYIGVYPNGKVRGTSDETDQATFLERHTGGMLPEHVKFQNFTNKLYIAMDNQGRLYGERNPNSDAAVFIESFMGSYKTYLSRNYAHLGWYLALKKSGKFKKGPKTDFRQKAIKFLLRRKLFE